MIERFVYKGHDILRIIANDNQRRSMQFGRDKARLILSEIEAITQFAGESGPENEAQQAQGEAIAGAGNTDAPPD